MRLALVFVSIVLVLGGCAQSQQVTQSGSPVTAPPVEVVDDRQLLVLTRDAPEPLTAQVRQLGYVVTRIDRLQSLRETMVYLRIPEGRTIPEAIVEVEALQPGITAGANHAYRVQLLPDQQDFAAEIIGWPASGCPAYRDIGLIDAGVTEDHPALLSGRIVQTTFHASEKAPATTHGTLMADLLIGDGRLTAGRLFSANVVDPQRASGELAGVDAILRAVDWLKSENIDLVNVSLAGPYNRLLNRAMGAAASDGVIFVAAAGNLGPDAPPQYPAAFPFVLAVTAVDRDLEVYPWAVQGDHIDLAAPGVDIIIESAGEVRVVTGTSAATPYVTAIVAADEGLSAFRSVDSIRQQLELSAKDLGPTGRDHVFGVGLIKALSACTG